MSGELGSPVREAMDLFQRNHAAMFSANGLGVANVAVLSLTKKVGRAHFSYEIGEDGEYIFLVQTVETIEKKRMFSGVKKVKQTKEQRVSFGELHAYLPHNAVVLSVIDEWMYSPCRMCIIYAILPKT